MGYNMEKEGIYTDFYTIGYSDDVVLHQFERGKLLNFQQFITSLRSGGRTDFTKLINVIKDVLNNVKAGDAKIIFQSESID